MVDLDIERSGPVAVVALGRGKVNALNESFVRDLSTCFSELEQDDAVRAIVLTGRGPFFSFGFDIPEFLGYPKKNFIRFLTSFTALYARLFAFPKPIVAALNGYTIAGGCMIALACDHRLMNGTRAKISLNEITFGASVFAGCVEMLQHCVGSRNAETVLYSGALYAAEEAHRLGLIDAVTPPDRLMPEAEETARRFAGLDAPAFRSMKALLRDPVAKRIRDREKASVREFADIWYSEATWSRLQEIKIRS